MIREIIIEFKEGENSVRKRILGAIQREINIISLESDGIDPNFYKDIGSFETFPEFPGKLTINVFDENEELLEIIET